MNCSSELSGVNDAVMQLDRRQHARVDIPAAAVVVGQPGENPRVLTSRILNLSQSGANIASESRISEERLWLAFTADERLILEAEVVWFDDTTSEDDEFNYGLRFVRSLQEQEFIEVMKELKTQPQATTKLNTTLRQREESLYSLFRGHSPQGARAV